MKILIGGDIVPTRSNFVLFSKGELDSLVGEELRILLSGADAALFNLEVPLTDVWSPIDKNGPNLIAPTSTIFGLAKINHSFFGLANNHIMDQGRQGLESTISLLDKYGISHSGSGLNLKESLQTTILNCGGVKIGVYCCAEKEFSVFQENVGGATCYDPLISLESVSSLKKRCDYVVVLYHGGKELYQFPAPYLRERCHQLVLNGADIVVTQHSHCVGAREIFQNKTIVYGQGNFLFDYGNNDLWKTGLLIEVNFQNGISQINYVPIVKFHNGVRLATGTTGRAILGGFEKRSSQIINEDFICKNYKEFAIQQLPNYLLQFYRGGNGFWIRVGKKLLGEKWLIRFIKRKYKLSNLLAFINYLTCEAHSDLLLTGLKEECKKESDDDR